MNKNKEPITTSEENIVNENIVVSKNDKQNKQNKESKQNKEPLSERLENGIEEVITNTQEFFYGEGKPDDIPVMMEHPSGIKRINKVQTRRNLNKRLLSSKVFWIVLGIIFVIPITVTVITFLISLFM